MPVTVAMALMMEVIVAIVIVTVAASQKRISSIFYLQSFLIIHPIILVAKEFLEFSLFFPADDAGFLDSFSWDHMTCSHVFMFY